MEPLAMLFKLVAMGPPRLATSSCKNNATPLGRGCAPGRRFGRVMILEERVLGDGDGLSPLRIDTHA